jgi:hypothetical protein
MLLGLADVFAGDNEREKKFCILFFIPLPNNIRKISQKEQEISLPISILLLSTHDSCQTLFFHNNLILY